MTQSASYHLEIQTHRKNPYGVLRTSYRENGKVKHKTIASLPGLSLSQLRSIQASLQNKVVPKEAFNILSSREYGASFACYSILKELGLHKAIYSRPAEEWGQAACAMIIGRLVYAGSKLSLSHCSSYSALWEICGIKGDVDVNVHCYDAMDKLFNRQHAIQKHLAAKHLDEGVMVLYDITSCYMEGEYEDSEIVAFGYNRDKKRGHEQIVISLLCNKEGCPIAVEVFKGNTKDETTVLDKIAEIKKQYGIENFIFVGDRGMITQAKYKQIDHNTVKVISALNHGAIQRLHDDKVIQMSLFDEKNIIEILDGQTRYMLCKNPIVAEKEKNTRQKLINLTTEKLDKIIASTRKCKNSKAIRAGMILNKYKMAKFITCNGLDDDLSYTVNQAKIDKESQLDGCYIVFTDAPESDLSAIETVKGYKDLIKVENAFRAMKTVRLETRPIYHKTDDRIKCHVFICMLAYYIQWHMYKRLAPLCESDGVGTKRKYTFDYMMKTLESIRKESVSFQDVEMSVISTPTEEQRSVLSLLGVDV
jgi:transposase